MATGHIEERDGSYTLVFDLGRDPITGKRRRKYESTKSTRIKDARAQLRERLVELNSGVRVQSSKISLGNYLVKWLENYGQNLAQTTLENYTYVIKAHLIPKLGSIALSELQPITLQEYYTKALQSGRRDGKGGLSLRTVQYHHTILREALSHAVKWRMVARNVADAVEAPRPKRSEPTIVFPEDVALLFDKMQGHALFPLFYAAFMTGMRRSELLGLRWRDVDLERGVIQVTQTCHRIKGEYIFKPPKNDRGRTIRMSASLISFMADMDKPHELVFCQSDGKPLQPRTVSGTFKALTGVNFHAARHTHATALLAANEHPRVVQERLGHKTISITLDTYSHIVPGMQEAAATKIEAAFGRQKTIGRRLGDVLQEDKEKARE